MKNKNFIIDVLGSDGCMSEADCCKRAYNQGYSEGYGIGMDEGYDVGYDDGFGVYHNHATAGYETNTEDAA